MRPAPLKPLRVATRQVRDGRKIQIAEVILADGERDVVRASVLRVRKIEQALPAETAIDLPAAPTPEDARTPADLGGVSNPFIEGVTMRVAKGAFRTPGLASVWFRQDRPIVADEVTTPLMRAAATADFCNGTSSVLSHDHWTFINADLTLSLARDPVGEWILLEAESWLTPNGGGIAAARLADRLGYFGRAAQSLVVKPRARE